jgi:signal peptidase II
MTNANRALFIFIVLIVCVSCDQASKSAAQAFLSDAGSFSFLGDTVRLTLAHNSGAFLSLRSALPEAWRSGIFSLGVGIMLLVLLGYILTSKSITLMEIVALSLILAGGAGNLVDRVLYGYVVDFMNIGIGILRTGIFNVADIAVTAGALLLVFDSVVSRNKESGKKPC